MRAAVAVAVALAMATQVMAGFGPAADAAERAAMGSSTHTTASAEPLNDSGTASCVTAPHDDKLDATSTLTTFSSTGSNSMMQGSDEPLFSPRDASSAARPTLGVTVSSISIALALLSRVLVVTSSRSKMARAKAAPRLQALARGRDPRRRLRRHRLQLGIQAAMAVRIQARARCYLAEIHLGEMVHSAECIQWHWRDAKRRELAVLEGALLIHRWLAATRIQAAARRYAVWRPLLGLLWRDRDEMYPFPLTTADGGLDVMDSRQVLAAVKQERRGIVRIQAVTRGYRVRAELRRPPLTALRAALGTNLLGYVICLRTIVARGFFGCHVYDRAGRNESLEELTKRHGGTIKKAGSAKKQRARKAQVAAVEDGTKVIETTRGDIICVAGPGAVNPAFIRKLVLRGRLELGARDRLLLCSAGVALKNGESEEDEFDEPAPGRSMAAPMRPREARGRKPHACK